METRPTTGKVKESLFSIIQFDIEGRQVLDLFAGTGQLGIEALSRGAAHCDFVDASSAAMRIVRDNVRACCLSERAAFYQEDFAAFLQRAKGNGIIICESPAQCLMPAMPEPYRWGREYRYGQIKLTLCHRSVSS